MPDLMKAPAYNQSLLGFTTVPEELSQNSKLSPTSMNHYEMMNSFMSPSPSCFMTFELLNTVDIYNNRQVSALCEAIQSGQVEVDNVKIEKSRKKLNKDQKDHWRKS